MIRKRPDAMAAALDTIAHRIESWTALDRVAERITALLDPVLSPPPVRDLASGRRIGHPVHPLLIAVPIGSWSAALLMDLFHDEDAARRLTALGLLATIPTAITGLSDWRYTSCGERRVGLVHAGMNATATTAYVLSWLSRRRGRSTAGLVWSVVGAAAMTGSGWLGGHLTYALGVGVDTTAFQHGEADWADVAAETDLTPGALLGAELDGVPIVLARTANGAVIALADRCSHRGAPLHEGELRRGEPCEGEPSGDDPGEGCLVCPWHGSVFATDGSVVSGPATRPQSRYDVRIRAGRVWVARSGETRSLRLNPVGR